MGIKWYLGFPGGSDGKESACNAGDVGSIPGSERFPGEGNGNPFQYSCLENPMDRGAWWAVVHGVTKSQKWLRDQRFRGFPGGIILLCLSVITNKPEYHFRCLLKTYVSTYVDWLFITLAYFKLGSFVFIDMPCIYRYWILILCNFFSFCLACFVE